MESVLATVAATPVVNEVATPERERLLKVEEELPPMVCEAPLKAGSGFSYFPSSAIELKSNNEPFVLCSVPSSFNIQVTEY